MVKNGMTFTHTHPNKKKIYKNSICGGLNVVFTITIVY